MRSAFHLNTFGFYFIIYFFWTNPNILTAQWIKQSPIPTDSKLNEIIFLDQNNGWVFGDFGAIYRTDDGGLNWIDQSFGSSLEVTDACFINNQKGWIAMSATQQDSYGQIYTTEDGGYNWTLQYFNPDAEIINLSFISQDTGWALAHCNLQYPTPINKNFFLKTTNGGGNWIVLDSIDYKNPSRLHFINDTLGYLACGFQPFLMKTTDGGVTWNESPHITSGPLYDVFFSDPENGFSCGNSFYYTHDFGETWDYTASPNLRRIAMNDASDGWVISYNSVYRVSNGGLDLQLQEQFDKSVLQAISAPDFSNVFAAGKSVSIYSSADAGHSWQEISNGTHFDLYSVFFLDENVGWAGTEGDNGGGVMVSTNDGGNHWTMLSDALPGYDIFDIQFLDSMNGWVANGYVYNTIDGGMDWSRSLGENGDIMDLHFIDFQIGWCAGESGEIYKTTNGGAEWLLQNTGTSKDLSSVFFIDENNGWLAGNGIVMKSTDGGETWEESYVSLTEFSRIQFFDENTGYILGDNLYLKTYTGGEYWHIVNYYEINAGGYFKDMHFVDPETGYIIGYDCILKTTDGGETWTKDSDFPEIYPNALFFADELNGWLVGNDGRIFHTTSGGTVGISANDPENGFSGLEIHPNPVKENLFITIESDIKCNGEVEIFSLTGSMIYNECLSLTPDKNITIIWPVNLVSPGIYFCRLKTVGEMYSKKFIILH